MIDIIIYRFSGNQGFFSIPKKWCQECDLLVGLVRKIIAELGIENQVSLKILPWWLWFWKPLLTHFAWHAPILVVGGKLISQGVVLKKQQIIEILKENLEPKSRFLKSGKLRYFEK